MNTIPGFTPLQPQFGANRIRKIPEQRNSSFSFAVNQRTEKIEYFKYTAPSHLSVRDALYQAKVFAIRNEPQVVLTEINGVQLVITDDSNIDEMNEAYEKKLKSVKLATGLVKERITQKLKIKTAEQIKANVLAKTNGQSLSLKDEALFEKYKENFALILIMNYAEQWARLMEYEMKQTGDPLPYIAERTKEDADFCKIGKAIRPQAVKILESCWVYGEELAQWYQATYSSSPEVTEAKKTSGNTFFNKAISSIAGANPLELETEDTDYVM